MKFEVSLLLTLQVVFSYILFCILCFLLLLIYASLYMRALYLSYF